MKFTTRTDRFNVPDILGGDLNKDKKIVIENMINF